MIIRLLMASVLRRLLGGSRRPPAGYGYGVRRPPRSGFGMWGPFPSYSRRTRGGSQVRVSGCCLPIPLAMLVGVLGSAVLGARGLRRGGQQRLKRSALGG